MHLPYAFRFLLRLKVDDIGELVRRPSQIVRHVVQKFARRDAGLVTDQVADNISRAQSAPARRRRTARTRHEGRRSHRPTIHNPRGAISRIFMERIALFAAPVLNGSR